MNEAETMQLAKWAEMGARTRLKELDQEKADIYRVFPRLEPRATGQLEPPPERPIDNHDLEKGRKRKRSMSAKERKAVSKRMKAYWADKRKAG